MTDGTVPEEQGQFKFGAKSAVGCLSWIVFMLFFLYLEVGGISFAFARHGLTQGVIAIVFPPWAWWYAITEPFKSPPDETTEGAALDFSRAEWRKAADGAQEALVLAVLAATRKEDEPRRAEILGRTVPGLILTYKCVDHEYRSKLRGEVSGLLDVFSAGWESLAAAALADPPGRFSSAEFVRSHEDRMVPFRANPRLIGMFRSVEERWDAEFKTTAAAGESRRRESPGAVEDLRTAVHRDIADGRERARKVIEDILGR